MLMTPVHSLIYLNQTTMARTLIIIGIGGSIGSISRYLTQQFVQKNYPSSIPIGTLSVNIIGCFIIGLIYALAEKGNILSPGMRLLLATGFCGGYTTFSAFAYENIKFLREGDFFYCGMYISLSVVFGFAAVYLGILFIKLIS
jgi:fluoride exporter